MADITKCMGSDNGINWCPKKDTCKRYTSQPLPLQLYFVAVPWFSNNCEMYLENTDDKTTGTPDV